MVLIVSLQNPCRDAFGSGPWVLVDPLNHQEGRLFGRVARRLRVLSETCATLSSKGRVFALSKFSSTTHPSLYIIIVCIRIQEKNLNMMREFRTIDWDYI